MSASDWVLELLQHSRAVHPVYLDPHMYEVEVQLLYAYACSGHPRLSTLFKGW